MTRTWAAVGEPRVELFELLDDAEALDVLCAAPGLLPRGFPGMSELARHPDARMPRASAFAWRAATLGFLAAQVDALPQTAEWEARIRAWAQRLRSGRVRFLHQPSFADGTRMVSTPDRTLLFSGPLTSESGPVRGLCYELAGDAHDKARAWFEAQIAISDDFSADVAAVLEQSWAAAPLAPEDLYYKVLYEYFGSTLSALDREVDDNPLLDALTAFQLDAYHYAKGVLRRYGGVFLSDVVGLGKTWIAMALLKHLQDRYAHHALVVAPPAVCPAWQELAHEHRVELVTVSLGKLQDLQKHPDREVLVIDESHHFRNLGTQRYEALQRWLRPGGEPSARQVLLLSATPQNNDPTDILHQLRLMPDNYTRLPFYGESLDEWFRDVRGGRADLRTLLQHVVVRRTRTFVRAAYPNATLRRKQPDGTFVEEPLRFPERVCGPAQCLRYTLDAGGTGEVYDIILHALASMRYPLHGLAQFVLPERVDESQVAQLARSGAALRGLYKVLLLKRLESSLHAFSLSLGRLRSRTVEALRELDEGWVTVADPTADRPDEEAHDEGIRVPAAWFDVAALREALNADRQLLASVARLVHDLRQGPDFKLRRLEAWLTERPPTRHRTVVFTQFADTAEYLAEKLGQRFGRTERITGARGAKISGVRRFAPKANRVEVPDDEQIDLLVSTDALSEGVNLQDADTLVNYDLHWNPVRLIQRAGRIDRIGSENDEIWIGSFLPERRLEAGLGIEEVLRRRIAEFLEIFGEDSEILPNEERPDQARMVSAYTGEALREADASDEMDGLSRHVNRILSLRQEDPARFDAIAELRPGRRAWSAADHPGIVACRVGWYWNFWSVGRDGPGVDSLVELDDLRALDRLYAHVRAGPGPVGDDVAAGEVAEAARAEFAPRARQFLALRARPKLTATEQFVLDRLGEYRQGALTTQRPLVEAMEAWVVAGTAKAILQREGRRWKRAKLAPHAVFHEARVWFRRFPGQDEELGEPELVGLVLSAS